MSEATAPVGPKKTTSAAKDKESTTPAAKQPAAKQPAAKQPAAKGALSLREESQIAVKSIGKRPIEPSHLTVASTFRSVGYDRPIFASDLQTAGDFYSSGIRPIGVSTLQITQTYTDAGNRPVAPNEIDDPTTLMGYID